MFNQAIAGQGLPARLSLDHDPLFTFQRWQANLRLLEIEAIQTVPYAPVSHPFVERLIGTLRREYLDHCFCWNQHDLEKKLAAFRRYYNRSRTHQGLAGDTPEERAGPRKPEAAGARLRSAKLSKGHFFVDVVYTYTYTTAHETT